MHRVEREGSQPALFSSAPKHHERTLTENDLTLQAWRAAWRAQYQRDLTLPSQAAWTEVRRHCKRLIQLVPDADIRAALFRAYLRLTDPYLREREHPLRFALTDGRFQRLRHEAEREVYERRRLTAVSPVRPARKPVDAATVIRTVQAAFGPPWEAQVVSASGVVLRSEVVHAPTRAMAERCAARLLEWAAVKHPGSCPVLHVREASHGAA